MSKDYYIFEFEYKTPEKGLTKIFGADFVKENKNECKIIYNTKEYELKEYIEDIDKNYEHNKSIKIILIINVNITKLNRMLYDCKYLISIRFISKLENNNINESFSDYNSNNSSEKAIDSNRSENSKSFYNDTSEPSAISLKSNNSISINDSLNKEYILLSNKIFCNITNMDSMFYGCSFLISLPDLSKFDTKNVTNMSSMFSKCSSLITLPDISEWNTSSVLIWAIYLMNVLH